METTQELKLEYPCEWKYTLFIPSEHDIHAIVKEVVCDRLHTIEASQTSKKGTYISYAITLFVHSDDDRIALFHLFKSHQTIKFVL